MAQKQHKQQQKQHKQQQTTRQDLLDQYGQINWGCCLSPSARIRVQTNCRRAFLFVCVMFIFHVGMNFIGYFSGDTIFIHYLQYKLPDMKMDIDFNKSITIPFLPAPVIGGLLPAPSETVTRLAVMVDPSNLVQIQQCFDFIIYQFFHWGEVQCHNDICIYEPPSIPPIQATISFWSMICYISCFTMVFIISMMNEICCHYRPGEKEKTIGNAGTKNSFQKRATRDIQTLATDEQDDDDDDIDDDIDEQDNNVVGDGNQNNCIVDPQPNIRSLSHRNPRSSSQPRNNTLRPSSHKRYSKTRSKKGNTSSDVNGGDDIITDDNNQYKQFYTNNLVFHGPNDDNGDNDHNFNNGRKNSLTLTHSKRTSDVFQTPCKYIRKNQGANFSDNDNDDSLHDDVDNDVDTIEEKPIKNGTTQQAKAQREKEEKAKAQREKEEKAKAQREKQQAKAQREKQQQAKTQREKQQKAATEQDQAWEAWHIVKCVLGKVQAKGSTMNSTSQSSSEEEILIEKIVRRVLNDEFPAGWKEQIQQNQTMKAAIQSTASRGINCPFVQQFRKLPKEWRNKFFDHLVVLKGVDTTKGAPRYSARTTEGKVDQLFGDILENEWIL